MADNAWGRIEVILNEIGVSANAFAHMIGLKRSENLYQIKKGNHGISKDLAKRINTLFPQYSIGWLTCGSEEYLKTDANLTVIPLYERFPADMENESKLSTIFISSNLANGAQYATICKDDALSPRIMAGSYVLMKKTEGEFIYGNLYCISAKSCNLFRIIRKDPDDSFVRLVSLQPDLYDDIRLPKKEIKSLYQICGTITSFL